MNSQSKKIADYYDAALSKHGPTAKGMDWKDDASQGLRFSQFLGLLPEETPFTLLDYGCGSSAFRNFLKLHHRKADYFGFDISTAMLSAAADLNKDLPADRWLNALPAKREFDYCVASGVFNVKLDTTNEAWQQSALDSLNELNRVSKMGFAVNFLTLYSDPPKRSDRLFYASPTFFFDYCKTTFSKKVALLHDYDLYEFTLLVRKV